MLLAAFPGALPATWMECLNLCPRLPPWKKGLKWQKERLSATLSVGAVFAAPFAWTSRRSALAKRLLAFLTCVFNMYHHLDLSNHEYAPPARGLRRVPSGGIAMPGRRSDPGRAVL